MLLGGAAIAFFGFGYLMHRYEKSLIEIADKEIPDIEIPADSPAPR
jgi:hypothetical protein